MPLVYSVIFPGTACGFAGICGNYSNGPLQPQVAVTPLALFPACGLKEFYCIVSFMAFICFYQLSCYFNPAVPSMLIPKVSTIPFTTEDDTISGNRKR